MVQLSTDRCISFATAIKPQTRVRASICFKVSYWLDHLIESKALRDLYMIVYPPSFADLHIICLAMAIRF